MSGAVTAAYIFKWRKRLRPGVSHAEKADWEPDALC
jgi:hypothetical protein